MASIHDCLCFVEEVLGDCHRNLSSDDLEESDYVNFQLESCNRFLSAYISNVLLSQRAPYNNYLLLRELHQCINDLQQTWHVKLATLEGRPTMRNEGRPRKLINIELVKKCDACTCIL